MPSTYGYAHPLFLLICALALEGYLGRSGWLAGLLARPRAKVVHFARDLERRLNRPQRGPVARRVRGWILAAALLVCAAIAGWLLAFLVRLFPLAWPLELLLLLLLLRQRWTWNLAAAVATALENRNLPAARAYLLLLSAGDLESREAERMTQPDIAPLTITGLARRFSDSLVSPVLWYGFFGIGGLFLQQMALLLARLFGGAALNDRARQAPAGQFAEGALKICRTLDWPATQAAALLIMAAAIRRSGRGAKSRFPAGIGHRSWPQGAFFAALTAAPDTVAALRDALLLFRRAALLQAGLLALLLILRFLSA